MNSKTTSSTPKASLSVRKPSAPSRKHPPLARSDEPGPWSELAPLLPLLPEGAIAACAFSGGLDSRAMLECAVARYGAERVVALHVNHGIQEAAAAFESFCLDAAQQLGVQIAILTVDARPTLGESPEEAAREARMQALASECLSRKAAFCLLAHHVDDQAETLVLSLARGQGLMGLSGMGIHTERHGVVFLRPWLAATRESIRAATLLAGTCWTEDPTNTDHRFTRNKVRALAMPALRETFPYFAQAAARSMAHCAQAQELLDEVAMKDLASFMGADSSLDLTRLRELSRPRLANLLRYWLKENYEAYPSHAQTDEAMLQIEASARGGSIDIKCGHGKLVRHGKTLSFSNEPSHRPNPTS